MANMATAAESIPRKVSHTSRFEFLGCLPEEHVGGNSRPQHSCDHEEECETEFDTRQKGCPQDSRPGLCHDEDREGIGQQGERQPFEDARIDFVRWEFFQGLEHRYPTPLSLLERSLRSPIRSG